MKRMSRPAEPKHSNVLAAVDLGSNSFHLLVTEYRNGHLVVIDRLREVVRLGAGITRDGHLTSEAERIALACLSRFGERLAALPTSNIRAVGTNALRRTRHPSQFMAKAENALGHPIEIISGMEEARLIYAGVNYSLASTGKNRLVVDIGGGSTELVIGRSEQIRLIDSVGWGCLSLTSKCFSGKPGGARDFDKAVLLAQQKLEPLASKYRQIGWDEAVGASGSIRSIFQVNAALGRSRDVLTLKDLARIRKKIERMGSWQSFQLAGLDSDRKAIFPGGLAILTAIFESMGLQQLRLASGALREGLLLDLVGRLSHDDVREATVQAMSRRFGIDALQANRVKQTVLTLYRAVSEPWFGSNDEIASLLLWAAELHELGLSVAHKNYHLHGAYIIEHADLPGFSVSEQKRLAFLIASHRKGFPKQRLIKQFPSQWRASLERMVVVIRLAVLLHRTREIEPPLPFAVTVQPKRLILSFPDEWLLARPLLRADLTDESQRLTQSGIKLSVKANHIG